MTSSTVFVASPVAPQITCQKRVVVLPIPNSPLVSGSTFHLKADMGGCVHVPLITAAPETITAGKSGDVTARANAPRLAWRRQLVASRTLTLKNRGEIS